MDTKKITAKETGPYGNRTFVTEVTAICSMNPCLCIAALDIKYLIPHNSHRLTVADKGYCTLIFGQMLFNNLADEMVPCNYQQEHGQQKDGIEQNRRNIEFRSRYLRLKCKYDGLGQMDSEKVRLQVKARI